VLGTGARRAPRRDAGGGPALWGRDDSEALEAGEEGAGAAAAAAELAAAEEEAAARGEGGAAATAAASMAPPQRRKASMALAPKVAVPAGKAPAAAKAGKGKATGAKK
jgi:hypothetical protein